MNPDLYTIGVDFGTASGRAVIVRVHDGLELASATHEYTDGVIDKHLPNSTVPLPFEWALQNPDDYLEVFKNAVPKVLELSGIDPKKIIGIGIDFTACTILPTLSDGTPLCRLTEFRAVPHAWVKLWKHHAAQSQADRINALALERNEFWLPRFGGKISSEWFFAKALQLLEEAPEVYAASERILEAADWVVWQLCGIETRNACTAGYKAIYQDGQYPSAEFLGALNPAFADIVQTRMNAPISSLGDKAGELTQQAATWMGLPAGIAVAVGNVDAHVTVPAAGVTQTGRMVAIMGTSTCHILNGQQQNVVPGMCGVVDGGVIPDLYGYEAGQSGVGDIFGWFVKNGVPAEYTQRATQENKSVHAILEAEAATQHPGEHGLLALDWHNGNRSVLVDTELSGLMLGATLQTTATDMYRALIESTAFGARVIIDNFDQFGVPVNELVIAGGLQKNKMLMQIYADITGRPLSIVDSDQAPALGSAIHAAVAAEAYSSITEAAEKMGKIRQNVYTPIASHQRIYDQIFTEYQSLHDYFGRGTNNVMKTLKRIRNVEKT